MKREIVFRNIDGKPGRHLAVTPETAATEHLSVGYINLSAEVPSVSFDCGVNEKVLLCMKGQADVTVNGKPFLLGLYDALYIPRDSSVTVRANGASLLESSAPVEKAYDVRLVRWLDASVDPKLHMSIGQESMHRELYQLVSENVAAGRLLVGPTFSNKGNWTSWPPHEHRETLEEVYVYFNMPAPGFGIQLAYSDTQYPDVMVPVREGDAVVVHHGYHPNVAVPGHAINFVWILCAKREGVDRRYGVVNVQPEFKPQ